MWFRSGLRHEARDVGDSYIVSHAKGSGTQEEVAGDLQHPQLTVRSTERIE